MVDDHASVRPRLLVVIDRYGERNIGGHDTYVRETTKRLSATHGFDITILASRKTSTVSLEAQEGDVRVVRYEGNGLAAPFLAGLSRARALLAEWPADVVNSHFAYSSAGIRLAVRRDVPWIRTFHGSWALEAWTQEAPSGHGHPVAHLKRRIRERLEAWDLRGSNRVVALSDYARNYVVEAFGLDDARVMLNPGGVDFDRFHPAENRVAERARLGLPLDKRLLLFVGRLVPRKGAHVLIDAFAQLCAVHDDLHLAIVGDGPELESLREQARRHGLEHAISFVGFVGSELPDYYASADLCVVPSLEAETFGLVTLEALSSGTPVVGSRHGGTIEILRGLDERMISDGTCSEKLADTIGEFLQRPWNNVRDGQRLRAYAVEHFSWERHTEALARTLNGLLREGQPEAALGARRAPRVTR